LYMWNKKVINFKISYSCQDNFTLLNFSVISLMFKNGQYSQSDQ